MIQNIIYAKKVVLPSTQANVIQSLQMAAAFNATGLPAFFYPGLDADKWGVQSESRTSGLKKAEGTEARQSGS